jgi:TIGR03009 family protein
MTRLFARLLFVVAILIAAPSLAQQVPNRAVQPGPAQPGQVQPRFAQPQGPARPQQPVQRQAVRQTGGEQPVQGPATGVPSVVRQPAGVLQAGPAGPPPGPQQPAWIPLPPDHDKWINNVLAFWEARSNKIKAMSCEFSRWEYDPTNGPPNPEWAKTIASGIIKYAQPDKGKYQVTKLAQYAGPPDKPGEQPKYDSQDPSFAEHWISDGQRVFEFDARGKRVFERELPPEMQGKAIADGPLPFMFGARAETIKARYWVRGLPQGGNGKYWLEAVPKSIADARNFKAVTIVLDEKTYLPELLEVLSPNFDAKTNPTRSTYQFSSHSVVDNQLNPAELIRAMNPFKTEFYAPTTPRGWTRIVEKADGTTRAPTALSPGVPGALEATKPQPVRK